MVERIINSLIICIFPMHIMHTPFRQYTKNNNYTEERENGANGSQYKLNSISITKLLNNISNDKILLLGHFGTHILRGPF